MDEQEKIQRIKKLESSLSDPGMDDGKKLDVLHELWRCYWTANPGKSEEIRRKIDFYFYDKAIAVGDTDGAIEILEFSYFQRQARAAYTDAGDRCKESALNQITKLLLPLADKNQRLRAVYKKAGEERSFGLKMDIARYLFRRNRTGEMETLFNEFENEQDRALLVRLLSYEDKA